MKLEWRDSNITIMDTLSVIGATANPDRKRRGMTEAERLSRGFPSLILRITWTNLRHYSGTLSLNIISFYLTHL